MPNRDFAMTPVFKMTVGLPCSGRSRYVEETAGKGMSVFPCRYDASAGELTTAALKIRDRLHEANVFTK